MVVVVQGAKTSVQVSQLQARVVDLERQLAVAEHNAALDPLTGLANRRWFDRAVAMSESQAQREPITVGVISLDIDGAGSAAALRAGVVLHVVADPLDQRRPPCGALTPAAQEPRSTGDWWPSALQRR